jgi:hypothetical protein
MRGAKLGSGAGIVEVGHWWNHESMAITPDTLVAHVEQLVQQGEPIVTSRSVKNSLTAAGEDWGDPHGWPIRNAEDVEMNAPSPRLVKWRIGGMIGYSLAGDAAAASLAQRRGYTRLRP